MTFPVRIRPLAATDLPFVYQTWIRTAWAQHAWERRNRAPAIPELQHSHGMEQRIGRLLTRSVGLAAGHEAHPGQVLGYIVAEPAARALHMLYVKGGAAGGFRRMGIATRLVEAATEITPYPQPLDYYTQHTAAMRHLAKRWDLTFNPFLIEGADLPALEEREIDA